MLSHIESGNETTGIEPYIINIVKNPQNLFLISWKFHFCTTNIIVWILPSNWRHFEVHFFLISRKHILVVAKANFPQFLKNTKFPVWRRNDV